MQQSRPCGLCSSPVPQAEFQEGTAKVIGGTLLCPRCTVVIESAQSGTAALGRSLPPGATRLCEDCGDSVSVDEMLSGAALYAQSRLSCQRCSGARYKELSEQAPQAGAEVAAPAAPKAGRPSARAKPAGASGRAAEAGRAKGQPATSSRRSRLCPTCDGPTGNYQFGKQHFCSACGEVFEAVLAQSSVPPGSSAPCKVCREPATGKSALLVSGDSYCEGCRHSGELLVQLRVRELRTQVRHSRAAPPRSSVVAILGLLAIAGGGALAWGLNSTTTSRGGSSESRGGGANSSSFDDTPERRAFERALRAATGTPHSFAHAVEIETAVLAEVDAVASDARLAAGLADLLTQIRKAKRQHASGFAAGLLLAAAREAKAGRYVEAAQALDPFPAELADTSAGKRVAEARAVHGARGICEERARAALAAPETGRERLLATLLGSSDARRCRFAETDIGRRLAAEQRRLSNTRVLEDAKRAAAKAKNKGKGKAKPSTKPSKLLPYAARQETKGKLTSAAAAYEQVLDVDPFNSEAVMGRARVALARERFSGFAEQTKRSARLSPDRSKSLQAWLAHLGGDTKLSRTHLAGAKTAGKDPLVRRLKAMLALGDPKRVSGSVRLYASGVSQSRLAAAWPVLEDTVRRVGAALRLSGAGSHLDMIVFRDAKARAAFFKRLGRNPKGASGVLRGCFAIAPQSLDARVIRQAVVDSLSRRPIRSSGWLIAVLGKALAGAEPQGKARLPLARLEKLTWKQVLADPKALATALEYGRLLRTDKGARALAHYSLRRRRDPKGATVELKRVMSTH
jgi:hypothetical protein